MRRKNISYEQGKKLETRAGLPLNIGMELAVWSGEIQTHYKKSAPDVRLFGETPGSFAAQSCLPMVGVNFAWTGTTVVLPYSSMTAGPVTWLFL